MPWLVGDQGQFQTLEAPDDIALAQLWANFGANGTPLYVGYLLDGFSEALEGGRFHPARPPLAFRAGWNAVAVTARTDEAELARTLGPLLAPTSPRPHSAVPLGTTLFSTAWLQQRLGEQAEERLGSLEWAVRLNALVSALDPVFCDPLLELFLTQRSSQESQACSYRPPSRWHGLAQAVEALCQAL